MIRLRSHVLPAAILVLVTGLAVLVLRDEPPATWLTARAPAAAQADQAFIATVTLLDPMNGTYLNFDLHGQDTRHRPLRCVAAGTSVPVSSARREYTFALTTRDQAGLDRVHAVIYLSRTGSWSDRLRVARSESFPVVRAGPGETAGTGDPIPLVVHEQVSDPAIDVPNPPAVRLLGFLLWGAAAVGAGFVWRRVPPPRGWPLLTLVVAATAVWEVTATGTALASLARHAAQANDVYEMRRGFQQIATATALGLLGVIAAVGMRRSRRPLPALALAGLGLYAVVALAGMLSLHEVDRVLAWSVGPWPLAAVLRLGAACAVAGGMAQRLIRPR